MENTNMNSSINRIKKKMREKRMQQKRLQSTSFDRSRRLNRSYWSNTLYLNNKHLTASLESVRKGMRAAQGANLELLKERQALYERVNHLQQIADKKIEQMDQDVSAHVQIRMQSVKELLNKTSYSLLGTVDTIQEALQLCDQVPSSVDRRSGSIRGPLLSWSDEESVRNSLPQTAGPSIYFKKPARLTTSVVDTQKKCADDIASEGAALSVSQGEKNNSTKPPSSLDCIEAAAVIPDSSPVTRSKTSRKSVQEQKCYHGNAKKSDCKEGSNIVSDVIEKTSDSGEQTTPSNSGTKSAARKRKSKPKDKKQKESLPDDRNDRDLQSAEDRSQAKASVSSNLAASSSLNTQVDSHSGKLKSGGKARKSTVKADSKGISSKSSQSADDDNTSNQTAGKRVSRGQRHTEEIEVTGNVRAEFDETVIVSDGEANTDLDDGCDDVQCNNLTFLPESQSSEEIIVISSPTGTTSENHPAENGKTRRRSSRLSNKMVPESLPLELDEAEIFASKPKLRRTMELKKADEGAGVRSATNERRGTFVVEPVEKAKKGGHRRVTFSKQSAALLVKAVQKCSETETETSGDELDAVATVLDSKKQKTATEERDHKQTSTEAGLDGDRDSKSKRKSAKVRSEPRDVSDEIGDVVVEKAVDESGKNGIKRKNAKKKDKGGDGGKKNKPTKIPKVKLKKLAVEYDEAVSQKSQTAEDRVFDFSEFTGEKRGKSVEKKDKNIKKKKKSEKKTKAKPKNLDMSVFELSLGNDFSHPKTLVPRSKQKPDAGDLELEEKIAGDQDGVKEASAGVGVASDDRSKGAPKTQEKPDGSSVLPPGRTGGKKKRRRLYSETSLYSDDAAAAEPVNVHESSVEGSETGACATEEVSSDRDRGEERRETDTGCSPENSRDKITEIEETPEQIMVRRRRRHVSDLYKIPFHFESEDPPPADDSDHSDRDAQQAGVPTDIDNLNFGSAKSPPYCKPAQSIIEISDSEDEGDFSDKQPVFVKPQSRTRKAAGKRRSKGSTRDPLPYVLPAQKNTPKETTEMQRRRRSPRCESDGTDEDPAIVPAKGRKRESNRDLQAGKRTPAKDRGLQQERSPVVAKRSKRSSAKNICFKEPSLTGKLRRGDKYTLGWGKSGKNGKNSVKEPRQILDNLTNTVGTDEA